MQICVVEGSTLIWGVCWKPLPKTCGPFSDKSKPLLTGDWRFILQDAPFEIQMPQGEAVAYLSSAGPLAGWIFQ